MGRTSLSPYSAYPSSSVFTDLDFCSQQFWLTAPIGAFVAIIAYFFLPNPKVQFDGPKPALDFVGAAIGTSGLILLTFVLSSGGVYGWGKGFIIGILIVALAVSFYSSFVFPYESGHLFRIECLGHFWGG